MRNDTSKWLKLFNGLVSTQYISAPLDRTGWKMITSSIRYNPSDMLLDVQWKFVTVLSTTVYQDGGVKTTIALQKKNTHYVYTVKCITNYALFSQCTGFEV